MRVLIAQRGQVKRKVTLFKKFFEALGVEPGSSTQLRLRLEKLELVYQEFDNIQSEIELQAPDEEDEHVTAREEFEREYFRLVGEATDVVEKLKADKTVSGSHDRPKVSVKLPIITLPEFHGNYDSWLSFRDNFKAIIADNDELSNVQKLFYLKSALKGNTGNVVDSLETTEDNYDIAWKMVIDRFENTRLIVSTHVAGLFNLSKVDKPEFKGLRALLDCCNRHLGALKALNQPVDSWDTLLIHLITSKLDRGSYKAWEDTRVDASLPTFEQLKSFLTRRCLTLEAMENSVKEDKKVGSGDSRVGQPRMSRTFTLASRPLKCGICRNSHELYQCHKFLDMSVSDRYQKARAANVCLNCLRTGHRAIACKSSKCQGNHNTKLHFERSENAEPPTKASAGDEELDSSAQSLSTHVQVKEPRMGSILLSTAVVTASDIQGVDHPVRVLLD